ncbi:MAG TPA: hypothetical protein H9778_09165 [Candidatus Parabacteroides intestinavium]|nr:hypothetical protein [Candidatus Parabacteroides intestinavium]
MDKDNQLNRLLALLFLTFVFCCLLYYLPDRMAGFSLKRVDLFSDLRASGPELPLDSLSQMWLKEDTMVVDSTALQQQAVEKAGIDSATLALRDSLYKALYAVAGADSAGTRIEDYSVGHVGLHRFFAALRDRADLGRPVRVAFLGDSFIEGDILVADFRSALQQRFGGRGVGFVPITSVAAQYRPTVKIASEGWKTWSMLTKPDSLPYTLSGMTFEAEAGEPTVTLEAANRYPELDSASCLKLIYERNVATRLCLTVNGRTDSLMTALPPTDSVRQYVYNGPVHKAEMRFRNTEGFRALGVVMEDSVGVSVDNYSLRGNSGMLLEQLDSASCRALNRIHTYDLIVLQYGLNIANDSILQYGWYGRRMEKAIRQVRQCFPTADVLLMGVSDRSRMENGTFCTMPSVLALLHAQRQTAKRAGILFWNTFGAMGGNNSMVRYVEKNWASKDYTHLGFGGGRELARVLVEAILAEMEFYEEAERQ